MSANISIVSLKSIITDFIHGMTQFIFPYMTTSEADEFMQFDFVAE